MYEPRLDSEACDCQWTHTEKELPGGDWEVLFTPADTPTPTAPDAVAVTANDGAWPSPSVQMDNRDLDPPEPGDVRTAVSRTDVPAA